MYILYVLRFSFCAIFYIKLFLLTVYTVKTTY